MIFYVLSEIGDTKVNRQFGTPKKKIGHIGHLKKKYEDINTRRLNIHANICQYISPYLDALHFYNAIMQLFNFTERNKVA